MKGNQEITANPLCTSTSELLSIIVPVYFNEENLPSTIPRLLKLQDKLAKHRLELIFVDDGSKDKSLSLLLEAQKKSPHIIKIVKLTRNFGAMSAVTAGLAEAKGDYIGVIAADLQDPPELFIDMIQHIKNGVKIVFAVRQNRVDPFLTKLFAKIFYFLVRKFAIPGYPASGFDFFLTTRPVVKTLLQSPSRNTNILTLLFWFGFPSVTIPYDRQEREGGKSRWNYTKQIKLAIDTFSAFSYWPIRAASFFGICTSIIGFFYAGMVFIGWYFQSNPVHGWTALMIVLLLASGVQMIILGILGEYLWRTLDEARSRPAFIIDETFSVDLH